MQYAFLPVFLFVFCTIALAIGLLIVSSLFNPGHPSRVTRMPYESGMDPIHDTRRRFDVRFHLLAIAFLVFDVELLFLYPWAVATGEMNNAECRMMTDELRAISSNDIHHSSFAIHHSPTPAQPESPHLTYYGVMTFLLILTLGFIYDWRKGVFRWG